MAYIITADGKNVFTSAFVVSKINLIKNTIDDVGNEDAIPIPVSSNIFEKIVEFYSYRNDNTDFADIEERDKKFFEISVDDLFDIITTANFLDAPDILDVSCDAAANILRNKTPDEIRKILNITNVYSPEEEAEIIKENSWAFQPLS
jgi:hypothetical protein